MWPLQRADTTAGCGKLGLFRQAPRGVQPSHGIPETRVWPGLGQEWTGTPGGGRRRASDCASSGLSRRGRPSSHPGQEQQSWEHPFQRFQIGVRKPRARDVSAAQQVMDHFNVRKQQLVTLVVRWHGGRISLNTSLPGGWDDIKGVGHEAHAHPVQRRRIHLVPVPPRGGQRFARANARMQSSCPPCTWPARARPSAVFVQVNVRRSETSIENVDVRGMLRRAFSTIRTSRLSSGVRDSVV